MANRNGKSNTIYMIIGVPLKKQADIVTHFGLDPSVAASKTT
jgi:hypothetical protein